MTDSRLEEILWVSSLTLPGSQIHALKAVFSELLFGQDAKCLNGPTN